MLPRASEKARGGKNGALGSVTLARPATGREGKGLSRPCPHACRTGILFSRRQPHHDGHCLADVHETKTCGEGARAPSPLFCPVPSPAAGSGTGRRSRAGRPTGTALPVPCDKNLFPGPEKFFFPRLFLCWARPCGDLPPMGTPSASRSVFLKKVTDFIE